MDTFTETSYLIPAGDGSGRLIGINIEEIVKAEVRLQEVATVNIHNAAELLTAFNRAWLELQHLVTVLTKEKLFADNALTKARAEALLDCTADFLKAKGHTKPSADLRNALVDTDDRVTKSKDRLDEIRVMLMYLSGKQEAFKEGFSSVKKLVAAGQLPLSHPGDGNRPQPFAAPKRTLEPKQTMSDDPFDLPEGYK